MPYLNVQTNQAVPRAVESKFLQAAGERLSVELGKSEKYFMGAIGDETAMRFDSSEGPAAFVELAAIGLPEEKTEPLSRLLCELVETHLSVPADRVYVRFQNTERTMWGWNGKTFG